MSERINYIDLIMKYAPDAERRLRDYHQRIAEMRRQNLTFTRELAERLASRERLTGSHRK